MITTRNVSPHDPAALAMIAGSEEEQSALYPPHLRSALSPDELDAQGVRFYVGFDGATPVACGGYGIYDGYAELKRIFVAPSHRGQGLSGAVILACEDGARHEGMAVMRLETGLASPAAIKAYGRMGYTETGPFGAYEENGSSVFMAKDLI